MMLANRFTLNPVLVIVSLFLWHTIWGVPGAFLAGTAARHREDHLRPHRAAAALGARYRLVREAAAPARQVWRR